MKKSLLAAVSAAALLAVPTLALAAGDDAKSMKPVTDRPATTQAPAAATPSSTQTMFITSEDSSNTLSDKYVGAEIKTGPGDDAETIGTISELVFDDEDRIVAAVADVGGFLGIGGKTVAISWGQLEKTVDPDDAEEIVFTTLLSRNEIEAAPEFVSQEERRDESERDMRRSGTRTPATAR